MKKYLFLQSLIILFSFYIVANIKAQAGDAEMSVETYFDYLKNGDTEGILNILTDPLLSERRTLLENNTDYPEFLRKTYEGANLEIRNVERVDKDIRMVEVEIHLGSDGSSLKTKFLVKKVNDSWKISEEITEF